MNADSFINSSWVSPLLCKQVPSSKCIFSYVSGNGQPVKPIYTGPWASYVSLTNETDLWAWIDVSSPPTR